MVHLLARAGLAAALVVPLSAQNTGCAFDLNVDGYIEVPYSQLVVPQSGITVEAWFTYDDSLIPLSWRYPTIVRQGVSVGGSEDYFLRMNCNNNAARVLTWKVVTATGAAVTVNYSFAAGQFVPWTHVAATYDGAASNLYINGQLVGTALGNGQPIRDAGNEVLRIGKGSDVATPIEVWNGELDEVRLWPFARSQADIQATLNAELSSVPGVVSTWNLNNSFADSSGTLNATSSGQVTFTANSLALTPVLLPPALPGGASTPGCLGDLRLAPSAVATPGNTGFGIVCTRTPPAALAIWAASNGVAQGALPVLGIDVWLDLQGLVTVGGTANALGAVRQPIPVPATLPVGFAFGIQCIVLDPCGPQLFTASDALTVVVQ